MKKGKKDSKFTFASVFADTVVLSTPYLFFIKTQPKATTPKVVTHSVVHYFTFDLPDKVQESGGYVKHENHKCSASGGTFPTDTELDGDQTTNFQNCKDWCDARDDCVGFVRNELQICYFKKQACLTNIEPVSNRDLYMKEGKETRNLSSVGK